MEAWFEGSEIGYDVPASRVPAQAIQGPDAIVHGGRIIEADFLIPCDRFQGDQATMGNDAGVRFAGMVHIKARRLGINVRVFAGLKEVVCVLRVMKWTGMIDAWPGERKNQLSRHKVSSGKDASADVGFTDVNMRTHRDVSRVRVDAWVERSQR